MISTLVRLWTSEYLSDQFVQAIAKQAVAWTEISQNSNVGQVHSLQSSSHIFFPFLMCQDYPERAQKTILILKTLSSEKCVFC